MILPDYDDPITTDDAEQIIYHAESLLKKSGLNTVTWTIEMFGGKRTLGSCWWQEGPNPGDPPKAGKIKISRPWYVDLGVGAMREQASGAFPAYVLEDTIRHEIAHAVSMERYGVQTGSGHGWRWKKVAEECHALPERCVDDLPERLMASYERVCSNCGHHKKWLYQYSEKKRSHYCTICDAAPIDSQLEVIENEQKVM